MSNECYSEAINQHRLLVLIACCAEAKSVEACRTLSRSNLFPKDCCCVDIPDSAVTSHLLASLSYCIAHSGKDWMVQCDKVLNNHDIVNVQRHLNDLNETSRKLLVLQTKTNKTAINYFVTFLQPHFTLYHLELTDSDFDDDCITVLCEAVKLNSSLLILGLSNCTISSKGVMTIAGMLQINNTLQDIDLEYNKFSSDDLIQTLVTIKDNTTLRVISVESKLQQKPVKRQLAIFNKRRRHPLKMDLFHLIRFGGLLKIFGDA